MPVRLLLLAILMVSAAPCAATSPAHAALPLVFEENRGQAPPEVRFVGRGRGYDVLLGDRAATILLAGSATPIRLVPLGPATRLRGQEPLASTVNYILGRDPRRWALGVPMYARVLRQAHPGVRLEYYGREGRLEFDYVVAPGADPGQVRLRVEGATPQLTSSGDLALRSGDAELVLRAPHIYQESDAGVHEIAGGYAVRGDQVSFTVGAYDRALPLVIDPELVYASYLGGSGMEIGSGIAVSGSGYAHVTGVTTSANFPSAHAADGYTGDAFLVKLDPAGSRLVYATYFGGSGDDRALAVALDPAGNAYITGMTNSADLPVSSTAMQTVVQGTDAFVAKFGPTGVLLYATYLGGSGSETGRGIAVSAAGEAYVTGNSGSPDFPTTAGALQTACNACGDTLGSPDAFITRLNGNGSGVVYSTFLGGVLWEYGQGIALDGSGNALVVGFTASDNFPVVNPVQATRKGYQGRSDAFVSKLNPAGSALIYSTYLGSFQDDFGYGIAVDVSGNAYVAGESQWSDFPTTAGAYLPSAVIAGFLAKISPMGVLVYSTRVQAGGYAPTARGVAVNAAGEAFITGVASDQGSWTPFVQQFSANGSALLFSRLVGGISRDEGNGIALDSASNAYVTGDTYAADFPVTAGAAQPDCGREQFNTCTHDGFVARIGAVAGVPPPPSTPTGLAATGTSRSQMGLAWTASTGVVDGYRIQRCTGSLAACNYSQGYLTIATVTGTSTGYFDPRLPSGMTYSYRVQAFNSGGTSAYSNADDGTTLHWASRKSGAGVFPQATTSERQTTTRGPKLRQ
jgi:hypothetical protein